MSDTAETEASQEVSVAKSFSSTQINLRDSVASQVRAMAMRIPDADLAEDGRETEPHVTVKYGLHTDNAAELQNLLMTAGPINFTLGKTSIFPASETQSQRGGEQYDVVKIDVESDDLRRINRLISDSLEHTDTHPNYQPHVTLAYVKAGEGEKYVGMDDLDGVRVSASGITFSDSERNRAFITVDTLRTPVADTVAKSDRIELTCNILKAESTPTFTLIRGAVLIPDIPDHQGDVITADEIKVAAHRYMEGTQQAGVMHSVMVAKRHVHLVESYVTQTKMDLAGETIPQGSWVVAFRVYDPALRNAIAKGELAGFSIGGSGHRSPLA